jgi:hypothetical protein
MMQFLARSSSILSPDQFVDLTGFLADRRAAAREQMQARGSRFTGELPPRSVKALGLSEKQNKELGATLKASGDRYRELYQSLNQGSLTPEQARDQAKQIRADLTKQAQSILKPEQWSKVEQFRNRRIAAMTDRRLANLGTNVDTRVNFLDQVLALSADQSARVRQIIEGTLPQRRDLLARVQSGSMDPEDALYDGYQIQKAAGDQIRTLLTADQAKRYDALALLMPPGSEMGMGPGMGMGFGPGLGMAFPGAGMGPGKHGGTGGGSQPRKTWKSF